MVRVLLINAPIPERAGMPLISQLYIASSLLNSGHEVKIIDLNGKYFQYKFEQLVSEISSFQPSAVCLGLYTSTAKLSYDFLESLRSLAEIEDCSYIAGGPHATAVPEEPLEHSFDIVIRGEGEHAILDIMEYLEGKNQLSNILGISYKNDNNIIHHTEHRPFIQDLDSLPIPAHALRLVDPKWYFQTGEFLNMPAGLITSRGCPSQCTFCSNLVTGRKFRLRSSENVINEMEFYHEQFGTTFFSFWDDAFTSEPDRVFKLCSEFERLRRAEDFKLRWSCITRADKLSKKMVLRMAEVGCISINLGVESGSTETLKNIRKGIDLNQVIKSLHWCRSEGLRIQVNFMLGFPWEGVEHLQETLNFMKNIEGLVDVFSSRGVVIPFPGTLLYEKYCEQFGFQNWWLGEKFGKIVKLKSEIDLEIKKWSDEMVQDVYLEDPMLDMDFFNYTPDVKKMIKKCLEYKGKKTLDKLGISY